MEGFRWWLAGRSEGLVQILATQRVGHKSTEIKIKSHDAHNLLLQRHNKSVLNYIQIN